VCLLPLLPLLLLLLLLQVGAEEVEVVAGARMATPRPAVAKDLWGLNRVQIGGEGAGIGVGAATEVSGTAVLAGGECQVRQETSRADPGHPAVPAAKAPTVLCCSLISGHCRLPDCRHGTLVGLPCCHGCCVGLQLRLIQFQELPTH
jgi:hypothetical protein